MKLPKATGVLLCPKGEAYSMMSDADFANNRQGGLVSPGPELIEKADWATWFGNIKKLEWKASKVTDPVSGSDYDYTQTLTQWRVVNGVPVQENLGKFPFPANGLLGSGISSQRFNILDGDKDWFYLEETTGAERPVGADIENNDFFIHRDKFYFRHWYFEFREPDYTVTFSPNKISSEQVSVIGLETITLTHSLAILETFPNQ